MAKFFTILLLLLYTFPAYSYTWYFNAIQFDVNAPSGKGEGEIDHKKISSEGLIFLYSGVKCKFSALEKNLPMQRDLKCEVGDHEVSIRASCSGEGVTSLNFKPKGKFNQRIVVICENR